jgi:alkyl sulfatase BDS1-like metallo-beta-lactamase superfamily hydrolase
MLSADVIGALSVPQVFDSIAIRVDGPRAWHEQVVISWIISDEVKTYVTELRNGVLNYRILDAPSAGTTVFTLRRALIGLMTGSVDLANAMADGTIKVAGDATVLAETCRSAGPGGLELCDCYSLMSSCVTRARGFAALPRCAVRGHDCLGG